MVVGCKSGKQAVQPAANQATQALNPYQASRPLDATLLHTNLDITPNFENQTLKGYADLLFKAHHYPLDTLVLDARGFDISRVERIDDDQIFPLKYRYDGNKLYISLKFTVYGGQEFHIGIEYVAKPNSLTNGGGSAISNDKGLYFINGSGKLKGRPIQLWTQGETSSSSCWFPTIDAPNQKTSQNLRVTVDKKYKTLSNGAFQFSTDNANGTRTDVWEQENKHAPYLFTLVVGDFAVATDRYGDFEATYYVEPEYAAHAKHIFKHTPEMMDFYSKKLGVTFPWDKYASIVVRDYVSGAMENTSASTFGEFVQKDSTIIAENDNDGIVAHELFHQWFGDLVTCESWANLALNESFATYGTYLWYEYKYPTSARPQENMIGMHKAYFMQTIRKGAEPIIRYRHTSELEMFDALSYSKGGAVLHMLRNQIGDAAFFKALKYYLDTYRFQAAEIHHLRLAFETVTGRDMNWFFNQWFLGAGHPILDIKYNYDDAKNQLQLIVKQEQGASNLFELPTILGVWVPGKEVAMPFTINKEVDTFYFDFTVKPIFYDVDPLRVLLAQRNDSRTDADWKFMAELSTHYKARLDAMSKLDPKKEAELFQQALKDPSQEIKSYLLEKSIYNEKTLLELAKNQKESSKLRGLALEELAKINKTAAIIEAENNLMNLNPPLLQMEALSLLAQIDLPTAEKYFDKFKSDKRFYQTLVLIAFKTSDSKYLPFFEEVYYNGTRSNRFMVIGMYQKMAEKLGKTTSNYYPFLADLAVNETDESMWPFIYKNGEPIVKELKKSGDPASLEKAEKLSKQLERLKP